MKKEIAQLWSRALRSGEFSQGFGFLDLGDSYCPLGVLANLAMCFGICDFAPKNGKGSFDDQLGRIPVSVMEWAEMHGQNGEMKGEFVNLTFYNDKLKYSFNDIAVIVDENWEKL